MIKGYYNREEIVSDLLTRLETHYKKEKRILKEKKENDKRIKELLRKLNDEIQEFYMSVKIYDKINPYSSFNGKHSFEVDSDYIRKSFRIIVYFQDNKMQKRQECAIYRIPFEDLEILENLEDFESYKIWSEDDDYEDGEEND